MKSEQSTNKSSIKMAKLLLDDFYSKEELQEKLKIKLPTFFKNLKFLEIAGFDFIKKDEKFKIAPYKNLLGLSNLDVSVMAHILTLCENILPECKARKVLYVFQKITRLATKETNVNFSKKHSLFQAVITKNEYKDKIELFQKYLDKKTNLKVTTNNSKELFLKPLKFVWKVNKTVFLFDNLNTGKKKGLLPSSIVKMHPISDEINAPVRKRVVFELTGRLAKNYLLKTEEFLKKTTQNGLTIANYSEDTEKLYKRLLRYDTMCEIKFSANDKKNFCELIKKSLDNIDKFQDNIDK